MEYGTAQDHVLGHFCLLFFCNDIYLQDIYGSLILFANDTTLFNHHGSVNYLNFMLRYDIKVLSDWFKANQLSLSPSKSVLMYYNQCATNPDITLDGITIPRVKTHKFLRTWIDDDLKWDTQVSHVLNKLRTKHHLLSPSKNMLPVDCLQTVYFSHIYTNLQYNLGVWESMLNKSQSSEIFMLQKQCVHLLGKGKNIPVEELFKSCKVIKFLDMIWMELCKFGAKVVRKTIPEPLRMVMEA